MYKYIAKYFLLEKVYLFCRATALWSLGIGAVSFLGLGVVEPTPSWGLMLSGVNSDYYRTAAWMIIYPGLAVSIAVFSFNLFGDSLRDWLDPKLKL